MGTRTPITLLATVTAAALIVPAGPTFADPEPRRAHAVRVFGNGLDRNAVADVLRGAGLGTEKTRDKTRGYPRQTTLPVPPVNPADASIKLGLAPYHELAVRLNDLQRRSNRVSAEVVGRTHQGRDLYLVTVTAPENPGETHLQAWMRSEIEDNPARAAHNPLIARRYKVPIFINNNIHGNEWEGTDASLRVIEELATGNDANTRDLLSKTRIYVNLTANPDGRVNNHRANGAGFDMNRDFVTASQPEVRAMRQIMIDTQAVVMLDIHGYVNGTLIEPTTPPHGQNYEYDLFIKDAYANGVRMEAAVNGLGYTPERDGVEPVQIPFRDFPEGWDDWPPIFTPQYAPFHGTLAAHTIEIPLRVNGSAYTNEPVDELRRRSRINVDIAATTIRTTFSFTLDQRPKLLADQIEVFRRGAAGEAQRPAPPGWVPGFGPEDVYTTTFPRAYVVPVGSGQRSAVAAARLVDFLVANDVRVSQATRPFTLSGRRYSAGSYLVDMHQSKRGMANVLLEAGRDITPDVDTMYDISAWSHGLIWGAAVDAVPSADPRDVRSRSIHAAAPTGLVPGHGDLALRLDDVKEVTALNELLAQGVAVTWGGDGSVLVPASARTLARVLADRYGVQFRTAAATGTAPLRRLTIAAAASADELFTFQEMGFALRTISTAVLNAGFDWSGVDVLYASSGLNYAALNPAARAALDAFFARGGVVTRGGTGAAFNGAAGLLTVTPVVGRGDANGIVRIANAGGPVSAGLQETAFVYTPRWFTALGPEVAVEQRYGPLVAGHWRPNPDGTGGQDAAATQPAVVRGLDERGAAVVLFGTEPMFRNHPKGMFAQVARALFWTSVSAHAPVR